MQFYGNSAKQTTSQSNTLQGFNLQMPDVSRPGGNFAPALGGAVDDMLLIRHNAQDQAKRYRRRSIHTVGTGDDINVGANLLSGGLTMQGSRLVRSANGRIDHQQHPLRSSPIVALRPASSHGRNSSSESVNSTRSMSRPNSVSTIKKKFAHR
jgi:hypothetical protein